MRASNEALIVGDGLEAPPVELDDDAEHADALLQGAVVVVGGEGVLLQLVLADDFGNLEHDLLVLGQRVTADQLHDLAEILLLLQHVAGFLMEGAEVSVCCGLSRCSS